MTTREVESQTNWRPSGRLLWERGNKVDLTAVVHAHRLVVLRASQRMVSFNQPFWRPQNAEGHIVSLFLLTAVHARDSL